MLIHFGEQIQKRINEVGLSKVEFGRRISLSRQGVDSMLKKESMNVMLLHRIGVVLDYDFLGLLPKAGPIKPKPKRYFVLVEVDRDERDEFLHQFP